MARQNWSRTGWAHCCDPIVTYRPGLVYEAAVCRARTMPQPQYEERMALSIERLGQGTGDCTVVVQCSWSEATAPSLASANFESACQGRQRCGL